MSAGADGTLIGIAAAAAFAAGLVAVAQHASTTSAGYELAVEMRTGEELRRRADAAERRVTYLRSAAAARARAAQLRLGRLEWPKRWNVVSARTLEACAAPAPASVPPAVPPLATPAVPASPPRSAR